MPYSLDTGANLPPYVQKLPRKKQRQWVHVWNSAYQACMQGPEGKDSGRCESKAFAESNGVAMHSYFKTLTSKARKAIPADKFAYTDPQGGKHLPVHDLAHLRNAISRLGQGKTLSKWLSPERKKALQAKLQARLGKGKAAHSMAGVTTDFKKMSRDDFLAMIAAKKGKKGGKKDKNGKAVLPAKAGKAAADKGKADHSMADFATDLTETKFVSKKNRSKGVVKDGLVYRNGLIFRSGDYPDKQFSLSPNELRRAAEKFSDPLDIDLEHVPTPLDGKLGRLMAVESNEDGTELHGVVAIPKWLDAILPKHKVSASWDRAKKTLAGLALVRHPRVSDAALMAAFAVEQVVEGNATHDDLMDLAVKMTGYDGMVAEGGPEGQAAHNDGTVSNVDGKVPQRSKYGLKALQKIHDITAGRGAVCRSEPEPGKRTEQGIVHYATAGERDALQGIHDMTLSHGAICFSPQDLAGNARTMPGRWTWEYPGVKSEGRVGNPANTKAPHFSKNPKGGKKMGKKLDSVMASLERDSSAPQANYTRGDSEEMRSVLEEKARLSEENRRLRLQGIYDRAVNFADSLIAEGRAVPAERDRIIEVHVQCGTDDGFVGLAGFSEGGSRVSQFESIFAARPKHMLDAEAAPKAINELVAFANQMRTAPMASSGEGPMTPERRRQLLGLDHVGKQVLKDEDHANGRANGNGRR